MYAPRFERSIEDSIANAIAVPPDVPLVITEGNYLLLQSGPWVQVPGLLDEVWYIELAEETRLRRLVSRHMEFGRDAAAGPGAGYRIRPAERGADRGQPRLRQPGRVTGPLLNFVAEK